MFKKINLLMLALIVLISLLPTKAIKVAAAFNAGDIYQEGKYKEAAVQPFSASWSKNSTNASQTDTPNVSEIFKPNYGELENENIRLEVITSEPVLDDDGTMYVSTRAYVANTTESRFVLYAVSPDGKVKWHIKTDKLMKGMAIHSNGNLLYNDGTLNAINTTTGAKIWTYQKSGFVGSPVIDEKGNVIILHNYDGIFALTSNGAFIDSKRLSSLSITDNEQIKGPQIRNDGTIFVINSGNLDSFSFENNAFGFKYEKYHKEINASKIIDSFAITTDGKVAYAYPGFGITQVVNPETKETMDISVDAGKGRFYVAPTVYSKDGSILYPIKDEATTLNKYSKDGSLIWSYESNLVQSSPVIDSTGNILFVEQDSSNSYLTSLKQDKTPNWSVKIPGKATSNRTQPIILKDKGILVAMDTSIVKVGGGEGTNDDQSTSNPPETEPKPEPEEKPETKLITVYDETNKYDTSSFNDKSNNTVYEYTEKKEDWYKIITAPNHTKWINSTNVIEGELDDSEQTVSITRDSFGYTKPFFYSKKTNDILKKDTEVKTYGKIGDWYLTKVNGNNVWFNQDEIKLTTFAPNKLYKEPNLDAFTGGIAQPQTLNVKDIQITTNTDYWYKVQSWLGDVYTLGEQAGFGSIQTVSQSFNAKDIKAFDTPFAETNSKTLNSEVTLVGKWQDWYKTSDSLWIKIQ
ncbi:outer membrane protein assembly factor BamB family protein [Priestia aryabhattai]